MTLTAGFVALGRPTFDVSYAQEIAVASRQTLDSMKDVSTVGSADLTLDAGTVRDRVRPFSETGVDVVVALQATFADSTLIQTLVDEIDCPVVLWAVPEERTGGRLRLNSLCGINLAAYALARREVDYRWVLRSPEDPAATVELRSALERPMRRESSESTPVISSSVGKVSLAGKKIGLVGTRPDGFEPCDYDPEELESITGVTVERISLGSLFETGEAADDDTVSRVRDDLRTRMEGVDDVDQESLARSLRIYLGLKDLMTTREWCGVATRCWPECFTDFGGAACAGHSLLTSAGTPGSCEADVYGNVTSLLLQEIADEPAFVADLVDLDRETNTAVFWHCGLAPHEMARTGELPRATIHSNRHKPLLNEFALRPGEVTIARLSQSRNRVRLVTGRATMLDDPLPFSGTAGVARLANDADTVLDTIMRNGLEHHYGIVYGDHLTELHAYAAGVGIEVVNL